MQICETRKTVPICIWYWFPFLTIEQKKVQNSDQSHPKQIHREDSTCCPHSLQSLSSTVSRDALPDRRRLDGENRASQWQVNAAAAAVFKRISTKQSSWKIIIKQTISHSLLLTAGFHLPPLCWLTESIRFLRPGRWAKRDPSRDGTEEPMTGSEVWDKQIRCRF